jgi:hypothetical protein
LFTSMAVRSRPTQPSRTTTGGVRRRGRHGKRRGVIRESRRAGPRARRPPRTSASTGTSWAMEGP